MARFLEKPEGTNHFILKRKGAAMEKQKIEKSYLDQEEFLMKMLKKTVEKEKNELVKKFEQDINNLADQLVGVVESKNVLSRKSPDEVNKSSQDKNIKKSSNRVFHEKFFKARNSLLTDLFKVNHISTIYHIFIAFLINLIINTAVYDVIKLGKINLGFKLIYWNFQSLPLASIIWLLMQFTTIVVYFIFRIWSKRRNQLKNKLSVKVWDISFLVLSIVYQILFLIIPASVIIHKELAIAVSFTLLMEQIRFVMKTYAFIRTIVPRVAHLKNGKSELAFPTFQKYMYFLFAPTLVYRDDYPRTSRVRWKIVIQHFIEIVGVIFYLAFIMENYLIPSVKNFGKTRMTIEQLLIIFFNNNVPCTFVFLCGFYSFLHSWMNAFAEILRFADRMFYQDWWNSSSFAEYYKTWNVIVHDWLYTFIYKDGTQILTKKKAVSTWFVFIISALFHEYILALTFKFCYPVLFIVFGILSTCLVFIPKNRSTALGNMLLWLSLFTGTGCCGSLYMIEYYARVNCPRSNDSPIRDFFVPRSWTCSLL